jgi:hypothetical protein
MCTPTAQWEDYTGLHVHITATEVPAVVGLTSTTYRQGQIPKSTAAVTQSDVTYANFRTHTHYIMHRSMVSSRHKCVKSIQKYTHQLCNSHLCLLLEKEKGMGLSLENHPVLLLYMCVLGQI